MKEYITIPEYFKRFVSAEVDLDKERAIPCPFHNEVHGKSFTYSPEKRIWRCWGSCHCGGGVVQLHRLNWKLSSDQEAEKSLLKALGIKEEQPKQLVKKEPVHVDESTVELQTLIARAIRKAKSVDAWLDLDYIMSKTPVDKLELEIFCDNH